MRFPMSWLSTWWDQMQRQAVLVHDPELYYRTDADSAACEPGEELISNASEAPVEPREIQ
ncbi:MAG: hypothetical protein OWT27_04580 [Firmicutes bacterium]|nr:hypothetical protein [Bacillota bacterium]